MSDREDAIRVVRDMYAAFEQGDLDRLGGLLADDIELYFPGPEEIPYTGVYKGRDEVFGFFRSIGEHVEAESFVVDRVMATGDEVIALGSERMRIKRTGATFEMDWADVFTVRGGRVQRMQEYCDTGAMLIAYRAEGSGY